MFGRLIKSKALRSRIVWIVTGVLLLPLLLFFNLSGPQGPSGAAGAAGVIFGKTIPWDTFFDQQRWVQRQLSNRFGDITAVPDAFAQQATWNRLILLEEAQGQRLSVTDEELSAFIQQLPTFQQDGVFLPDRYYRFLSAIGITPQTFERYVRDDMVIDQLRTVVREAVSTTDEDVQRAYQAAHERVRASFITRSSEAFRAQAEGRVTEEALQAHYHAHPELVRIPEQITFEYIGATQQDVRETLRISEEEIGAYYEDRPDAFLDELDAPRPLKDVREDIRNQLEEQAIRRALVALAVDLEDAHAAGYRFVEMALTQALFITRIGPIALDTVLIEDGPEPRLLQIASRQRGTLMSDVIETDAGVYVLRLVERTPPMVPPLEAVHETIRNDWITEQARAAARAELTALREELATQMASGISFQAAAQSLNAQPTSPTPFTRTEDIVGIGPLPAVTRAAFNTPVGELSAVLAAGEQLFLIMTQERIVADFAELADEEREQLHADVLAERQQVHLSDWLADVHRRADLQDFLTTLPTGS